jgi:hypothetical protein
MPHEDFAVAGWRHSPGTAFEQFHIEGGFDLAEQLGGGRLGQAGSGRGARQGPLVIEMHEKYELASLQLRRADRLQARRSRPAQQVFQHRDTPSRISLRLAIERGCAGHCNRFGLSPA